jgi:CBS domain-containing protein
MNDVLAKEIMTKKVITIKKEATVADLIDLLIKNKFAGVPVVDNDNNIVGIVTETDIILQESNLPLPLSIGLTFIDKFETYLKDTKSYLKTKVEDIMIKDVKTVKEDSPLLDVVNTMINNKINRVPVVDNKKKLVGIITRADIIKSLKNTSD